MVLNLVEEKIKDIKRMYNINKQLLETLGDIGFKIVEFARKYNYPLPSDFSLLLGKSTHLIKELNHPTSINKRCSVCNKLNPDNADYCCYCGSSVVITRIRQRDKSPENATEPKGVTESISIKQ